jgi:hypothetical protein
MSPLDGLQIATPCPMKFSDMKGDDRVRFCAQCKLHVYNLTAMTEADAVKLVTNREQRICVSFLRRADGTVITRDCKGGFSTNFWEKFGTFERNGLVGLVVAAVVSVLFASVVTLFGDNLRALFGAEAGGLPGNVVVERRVAKKPVTGKLVDFKRDNGGY